MTQRYFTHDEVVQALRRTIPDYGGIQKWSAVSSVDRTTVSMILGGRRPMSNTAARALGFAPVTLYVRTDETPAADVRALRPLEQASMRAEIEAAKREQQKAERLAAGLNAIIARAAKVLERKPIHTRGRSAK